MEMMYSRIAKSEGRSMEVEVRRRQRTLYYSGRAFILFGIWSGVKTFFQLYLNPINWKAIMDAEMLDYEHAIRLFFYAIIVVSLTIDILLRLYIGISAIREGSGKRKRITYVIFAGLYLLLTVLNYIPLLTDADHNGWEIHTVIIFDVSSSIALLSIIINSWKLRKLSE